MTRLFGFPFPPPICALRKEEQLAFESPAHHELPPTVMSEIADGVYLSRSYKDLAGYGSEPAPPASAHIAATSGDESDVPPIGIQCGFAPFGPVARVLYLSRPVCGSASAATSPATRLPVAHPMLV